MECLPTEAVTRIFSFLRDWRDLHALTCACRRFYRVLRSAPGLWRSAFRSGSESRVFLYAHPRICAGALCARPVWKAGEAPLSAAVSALLCEAWDWRHVCMHARPFFAPLAQVADAATASAEGESGRGSVVLLLPGTHAPGGVTFSASVVIVGLNCGDACCDPSAAFVAAAPRSRVRAEDAVVLGKVWVEEGAQHRPPDRLNVVICGCDTAKPNATAVSVRHGTALLVGSCLSSASHAVAVCHGPQATLVLWNSLVDKSLRSALWCKGGHMLCRNTRITGSPGTVVLVTSAGTAVLDHCEVFGSENFGIYAGESSLVMSDSVVHDTDLSCVLVRDSAKLSLQRCELHTSKQCGLLATSNAHVVAEDTEFHHTAFSCAEIRDDSFASFIRCRMHHSLQFGLTAADARSSLSRCTLEHNFFSGIIARSQSVVDAVECDLSRNKHSGAYWAQNATGSIVSCTIHNNGCSGVRTKGTPRIVKNHIEGNSGGIQQMGTSIAVLEGNVERNNEIVSPLVRRAIEEGFCTFYATGAVYVAQYWRHCETCAKQDDNTGCCLVCAERCHRGHKLGPLRFSTFFCDCPTNWGLCVALPPGRKSHAAALLLETTECKPSTATGEEEDVEDDGMKE